MSMERFETSTTLGTKVFEIKFTTDDKSAAMRVQALFKEEVDRARMKTIKEKVNRITSCLGRNLKRLEDAKIPRKEIAVIMTEDVMDTFDKYNRMMLFPDACEAIKKSPKFMSFPVEVVQGKGEKAWVGVRVDLDE